MPIPLLAWDKIKLYLAETYCIPFFVLYVVYFVVMEMRILGKMTREEGGKEQKEQQKEDNKQQ